MSPRTSDDFGGESGRSRAAGRRDDNFRRQRSNAGAPESHFRQPSTSVIEGENLTGRVKKLTADRGFGFVDGDNGVSYFFHRSVVLPNESHFDQLYEGERVTFQGIKSPKGPRCEQLRSAESVDIGNSK